MSEKSFGVHDVANAGHWFPQPKAQGRCPGIWDRLGALLNGANGRRTASRGSKDAIDTPLHLFKQI